MEEIRRELEEEKELPLKEEHEIECGIKEYINSFDELHISQELLRGIYSNGFKRPRKLQKYCLRPLLEGRDVIVQAYSDKTTTAAMVALQVIDIEIKKVQVIFVTSTFESIKCVDITINELNEYIQAKVRAIDSIKDNIDKDAQIIISTPKHINELILKELINFKSVKLVIIDEVDEMINSRLNNYIREILNAMPIKIQIAMFFTKLDKEILKIEQDYMWSPARILIEKPHIQLCGIRQYYIATQREEKIELILELLKEFPVSKITIYCNFNVTVDEVANLLKKNNCTVSVVHKNTTLKEKFKALKDFRKGDSRVLVTNTIIRADDIRDYIGVKIMYDLKEDKELHLNRIGCLEPSRTCSAKGLIIIFTTPTDTLFLRELENYCECKITELPADLS